MSVFVMFDDVTRKKTWAGNTLRPTLPGHTLISLPDDHVLLKDPARANRYVMNATADDAVFDDASHVDEIFDKIAASADRYIDSKYSGSKQRSFMVLAIEAGAKIQDADRAGRNAPKYRQRQNQLQLLIDWISSVLQLMYVFQSQVAALPTEQERDQFTWDYTSLDATDPKLSVADIFALKDPAP